MHAARPILLAMVLCDSIIEDRRTNKKTLVGLFNNIQTPSCPFVHPRFFVFLSLTGLHGKCENRLVCVNEETNQQLFEVRGGFESSGPQDVVDLSLELVKVRFPSYGTYHLEFWCGGHLLIARTFRVSGIAEPAR